MLESLGKILTVISTVIAGFFVSLSPPTTVHILPPTQVQDATTSPSKTNTAPATALNPQSTVSGTRPTKKSNVRVTPKAATTAHSRQPVRQIVTTITQIEDPNEKPVIIHRVGPQGPSSPLDALDVLARTDKEREKTGAAPLTWNSRLAQSAAMKARDLIEKKYFAHVSPTGIGVQDLAENVGYDYSLIGENLAMGDFTSTADLMDGWMNSPGHRANILKKGYTELGVAVMTAPSPEDGHTIWYAVQEFGRPAPSCVKPDSTQTVEIDSEGKRLDVLRADLAARKQKLDAGDTQRQSINDYNQLVTVYNNAIATMKTLVANYNDAVNAYNACIADAQAELKSLDS